VDSGQTFGQPGIPELLITPPLDGKAWLSLMDLLGLLTTAVSVITLLVLGLAKC
jgi:hypothetical protein